MKKRTKLRRSLLSSIVAVAMVSSLSFAPALASAKQESQDLAAGSISNGVPEWAIDDGNAQNEGLFAQAAVPAQYDLRSEGMVTPVKYQNPWGSCWAFGGISAAEISLLTASGKQYGAKTDSSHAALDLSERHLTYFALQPITDKVNPEQVGEGLHTMPVSQQETAVNPYANKDAAFNAGGMPVFITTLFAQGVGPVEESLFPYRGANGKTTVQDYDENDAHLVADTKQEIEMAAAQTGMTYDQYMAAAAASRGTTVEALFATFKQAIYDASTEEKGTASYNKYDDWSISEVDDQGHPNRLYSGGFVLKNGNVLPAYYSAKEDTEPQQISINAIKQELLNGHGVNIAFCADQTGAYTMSDIDPTTGRSVGNHYNQYTDKPLRINHGVCIVGWDDSYAASNFKTTAPGNGAWIVKNSWGSTTDATKDDLGNVIGKRKYGMKDANGEYTGCFYLSYYDRTISNVETMEFSANLGSEGRFAALQHDYMPAGNGFYVTPATSGVMSSANVFSIDEEAVVAKSVSTRTAETNMRVTFAIYELKDNAKNPADGKLLYRTSQNFEFGGYHRLDLDQPITFGKNKKYSVVTTASVLGDDGKRAYSTSANKTLSKQSVDYLATQGVKLKSYGEAIVNRGESYLYSNGAWKDWKDYLDALEPDAESKEILPAAKHYTDAQVIDNFSIKVYVEPVESTLVEVKAVPATCTKPGCIQYWYDTATGKYYKDAAGTTRISQRATVVPALGHDWDKGKVTKKATAYTKGVRTYTCKRCGKTKAEAIPATVVKGKAYKAAGGVYKVISNTAKKRTVVLVKAKAGQKSAIPAAVKIKGAKYKVVGIKKLSFFNNRTAAIGVGPNVTSIEKYDLHGAWKAKAVMLGKGVSKVSPMSFASNASLRVLVLKTTKLAKVANMKNCLKGSKVTMVKVRVGTAEQNKKYVKIYRKLFSAKKPVSGKRVVVV